MQDHQKAVVVKNLSKTFHIRDRKTNSIRSKIGNLFNSNPKREIKALKDISFDVEKGEFFGIVGNNGSGKSTLLKVITSVYQPDKGATLEINGKFQRLALGAGFDSELSARENIYLNASLFGMSFKKIGLIFDDIIEFSELKNFVDTKTKYFSSGMTSRLAFSIAINVDADILFLDEFGGVGDIGFRQKSEQAFKDFIIKGKTIIHVSHDIGTLKEYSDRVMWIEHGVCRMIGEPEEVLDRYIKS
jgi:ABC-2 type transport system ATP-binding protein